MFSATRIKIVGLIASAALLFGGAPAANAADCGVSSPTQDQYCPPSTIIEQGSSGLPFTGYDVGLAALAAVALVGAGIGLHRAARADEGT
jgi:hypothetical protein